MFDAAANRAVGVLRSESVVVNLSAACAAEGIYVGDSMRRFIALGDRGMEIAAKAMDGSAYDVAAKDVKMVAPIYDPEKIICIGMNYREVSRLTADSSYTGLSLTEFCSALINHLVRRKRAWPVTWRKPNGPRAYWPRGAK